jgi:hypothetical protein
MASPKGKRVSLFPVPFEEAVADLMKVSPKNLKGQRRVDGMRKARAKRAARRRKKR